MKNEPILPGAPLVVGAGGFIGRRLLRYGGRALVRSIPHGFTQPCMVGDLLDPDSLRRACEGVETVFHCAGIAHSYALLPGNAHGRINYEGTCNLLEAAGKAGVRRFVFLSSVKAMADPGNACADEDFPGEPDTPYGRSKRAAEKAVLEAGVKYGMHVVNLRLSLVYGSGSPGNMMRMAQGIRAGWFPPLPETGNRRSVVHVDDVIDAIQQVAERPEANGRTYIIADPQPYSGREIYDTMRAALSLPPATWRIPAGLLRSAGKAGSLAGTLLRHPLPLNSMVVERLLDSAWYSPQRIENELGWRAKVGLQQGVQEMMDMFP